MAIPRLKSYQGPAILSYGFRPFFLLGALWAAVAIFVWLGVFEGRFELATRFAPVDWHIHEMLFGFLPAIATGFLFTAVPNWTGRMPLQGLPLLALVVVWLCGRAAVAWSEPIGWIAAMVIDLAFLFAVAAAIAIEVIAGRNWRNLKTLIPLAVLAGANAGFHLEAHFAGLSDISRRAAILAIVMLIMIIGGRITPSFTRNWLARENPGRLPAPYGAMDTVAIVAAVVALLAWTVRPDLTATGVLMAFAAAAQLVRLARWAGYRTLRDPLVAVLHLSYLFVPIGLAAGAAAAFFPDRFGQALPMHAFGAGAMGTMALSVMVRVTLGHTGRRLAAGRAARFIFAAVFAAAVLRILAALLAGTPMGLLHVSALAWILAYGGYGIFFATALARPRL